MFARQFVAMKTSAKMVGGLRCKLLFMGVPTDGPLMFFYDNGAKVINSKRSESTLKKKHNMMSCHCAQEKIVSDNLQGGWQHRTWLTSSKKD
jgi:hypothetical protein